MRAAIAGRAPQLSFESADALVFDPIPTNRGTARTALAMLGFRQVTATSMFDELSSSLGSRMFDLLVLDVTQDPVKTCSIVRQVREGRAAINPFLHIILMAWKLEGDLVQLALNCGADDLITRPFSVDFLGARIRAHVEMRKAFVVTSDYVGPDRRRARPPQPAVNRFDVPNTLLNKACDRAGASDQDEIRQALAKVNAERARKNAFQIAFLMRTLRDAWDTMAPVDDNLIKLEAAAQDILFRIQSTAEDAVRELATSFASAASAAQKGENVAQHVDRMGELGSALLHAFHPEQDREALMREVEAAVSEAKARGRGY